MNENETMVTQGNDSSEVKTLLKKQLFWQRISAVIFAGILGVMIYSAATIIPAATSALVRANEVATDVENSLDNIDKMVAEMTDATVNLNKLVQDNSDTITGAVKELSEIDFDGLNKAIKDLQDAVGPVASFFKKFR